MDATATTGSSQTSVPVKAEERSNDSKGKDKAHHPVVSPPKAKKGGFRVTFPNKLYKMLESVDELGLAHTVSWHPDGRSFQVHDVSKFETLTLHQFFEATMFRSIQRQLHLWGFQRDGKGGWCHKYFIRGCPEKLSEIFRTKIKGNGNAFGNKPALMSPDNNFGMYISAPQGPFCVSPETANAGYGFRTEFDEMLKNASPAPVKDSVPHNVFERQVTLPVVSFTDGMLFQPLSKVSVSPETVTAGFGTEMLNNASPAAVKDSVPHNVFERQVALPAVSFTDDMMFKPRSNDTSESHREALPKCHKTINNGKIWNAMLVGIEPLPFRSDSQTQNNHVKSDDFQQLLCQLTK